MMDFFFWLGVTVFLYYLSAMIMVIIFNDCDISTAYAENFGKSIGNHFFLI